MQMRRIFLLLLIFLLLSWIPCHADILETHDAKTIETVLKKADSHSLVIFDIDDVILVPIPDFGFKGPLRKAQTKRLKASYTKEQLKHLWSAVFTKRRVQPVDPRILKVIKDLQKRHIPTIALTGWWTGQYGKISHIEEIRFKDLEQVGVSFAHSSPFKHEMTFPKLKTEDGIPLVKSGVIFTALADKGTVLKQALQHSPLSFQRIVFVDDDLKNLDDVEKICHALGVEFQGIHYTASKLIPIPEFSAEKEALRFKILETEQQWLTDGELKERLGE